MPLRSRSKFWIYVRRLTQPLASAWIVFAADLARPLPPAPPIRDFAVRLFHGVPDLHAAIDSLVPLGLTRQEINLRFRRGDLVAVGFFRHQPVAYTWASFDEMWASELRLKVARRSGQLIQYDTLVQKEFRRHGFQFAVAAPVLDYAQRNGYSTTLAWVNAMNRPSCKNQRKWGKSVAMIVFLLKIPGTRRRLVFSVGAPINAVFVRPSANTELTALGSRIPNR